MAIELRLPERTLSEDMLLALSLENPGYRFERSAVGKLVVSPAGLFTSGGEGELFTQVSLWVISSGIGRAFPPSAGFTLPDSSIVSPDTTYVTNERLESMTDEDCEPAYARLVPNVVFELVSPSEDVREVEKKMYAYIANGVNVAVMIDPDTATVTIWRPRCERAVLTTPSVEVGPEMPGFKLDVAAVMRAAKRRPKDPA